MNHNYFFMINRCLLEKKRQRLRMQQRLKEMSLEEPNFKMMPALQESVPDKAKSKAFRSQNTVGTEKGPKPGTSKDNTIGTEKSPKPGSSKDNTIRTESLSQPNEAFKEVINEYVKEGKVTFPIFLLYTNILILPQQ